MRRDIFSGMILVALASATTALAAPNAAGRSAQYLNQISEQTSQIQIQADQLETYLRSGAHDWVSAAAYTVDMAEGTQKLSSLLDQYVSQPGTTNETRQQVGRMRTAVAELQVFVANAYQGLDSHAMALHLEDILASTSNIEDRGNMIRSAAQALAGAN